MTFTPLFLGILSLGIAFFAISGLHPVFFWMGVTVNALAVALAVADFILTPDPGTLDIERQVDEKLSLGVPNPVVLRINNHSNFPAQVRIKDTPPYTFNIYDESTTLNLAPFETMEYRYRIIPPARGNFRFQDIYVRRVGLLGILVRQLKISAKLDVKVYPDLTFVRAREESKRKGRIPEGRPKRIFGRGTEFESLRDYRMDDEFRNIDWKATARRSKLTSRDYQLERSQNVIIVLDAGRNMGVVSDDGLSGVDYAVNAASALAFTAISAGDQVGLMVFSGEVYSFVPPKRGNSHALTLLQELYDVKPTSIESDYATSFLHLSHRWRKRSLIILLTDLIDPDSSRNIINHLAGLSRKHLPICVAIGDKRVNHTAGIKPREVKDVYRKAVASQVIHERRLALSELEHAGVVVVDTDGPSAAGRSIEAYFNVKSRGLL